MHMKFSLDWFTREIIEPYLMMAADSSESPKLDGVVGVVASEQGQQEVVYI
jgi:hypothetical protein